MPVLITGATGMLGRAVARRLLDDGAQVRAYVRRDDAELRASGVHVALGAIDDVQRLEAALTRVHTIVHLVGSAWPERDVSYDFVNRESVECAVIAARAADVRRFVFVSFPGADAAARNEFLVAKGAAEEHVRTSGMEYAIFRPAPTMQWFGRTFERLRRGRAVSVPGSGTQRWNPTMLDDVVGAIVAADARHAEVHGVWELGGEQTLTLDEIAARVAADARPSHVELLSAAPKTLSDVLARETVVDARAPQLGER